VTTARPRSQPPRYDGQDWRGGRRTGDDNHTYRVLAIGVTRPSLRSITTPPSSSPTTTPQGSRQRCLSLDMPDAGSSRRR
jgi:hypothetical protein